MIPIPFRELMTWAITEYRRDGSMFGVRKHYQAGGKTLPIFGETIETPYGPAAGPNTQLAQNLIAGYLVGSRFFELKTVQRMDGAELSACISRPCILAEDEGYNCEWSTELYVQQAFEEYVKGWCACKILAKVFGLGDPDGFVFNMSVGYDLEGIKTEKIDNFLNGMMDARETPIFKECIQVLKEFFPAESDFIDTISPRVSGSVTMSTLHGCPPEEIERIASYLIREKHLNTYVKCNPTLLGYDTARSLLDSMGYKYVAFDHHHFEADLQYEDAIPMFHRLRELADSHGVEFGLKLSNTFPVAVKANELPSEEMYMSGKALYPLTVTMAARLAREFDGKLRLSYSGGADYFNIDRLFECGIWPVTMATTELKPGGYERFVQIGEKLDALPFKPFTRVNVAAIESLAAAACSDAAYIKRGPARPKRKSAHPVPLLDCSTAGCEGGCPFGQDIPAYLELCRKGLYAEALKVIVERNPLPFITGTTCYEHCAAKCARNFYDNPVEIRETKLLAARRGYDALMASLTPLAPAKAPEKVAVIGGGAAGLSAAYLVGRAGIPVTIFERSGDLGGILRQVIPAFREDSTPIEKDIALVLKMGAEVRLNTPAPSLTELQAMGYTHIFLATGKKERDYYTENQIEVNEKGRPAFETNLPRVFAGGDATGGPSSVAHCIADAHRFAEAVIGCSPKTALPAESSVSREDALAKRGILCKSAKSEGDRCLNCSTVCESCVDVCPNRANAVIELPDGRHQILHIDRMCNECGNCAAFCPYSSAPFRDKFTLFLDREGFDESANNSGFLPLEGKQVLVRLNGRVFEADLNADNDLPADIEMFILTVLTKYNYLLG